MRRRLFLATAALSLTFPARSGAEGESRAKPPTDLASIDLHQATVRVGAHAFKIGLPQGTVPDESAVFTEEVSVGHGHKLVHVRVPRQGAVSPLEPAWELLAVEGEGRPLFEGLTGFTEGEFGERSGQLLQFIPPGDGAADGVVFVVLGTIREEVQLCGEPFTLLSPRALAPDSLEFVRASVQRLSSKEQADAEALVATPVANANGPLSTLLAPRASSDEEAPAAFLFDGDPTTRWSEASNGVGQGEFAIANAPALLPLTKLRFTLPEPEGDIVVPRRLFVLVDGARFSLTFPDVWPKSASREKGARGARAVAFDVTFPKPIRTSCLSVVLGEADRGGRKNPVVTLLDVQAFSEFDDTGMESAVKALSGPEAKRDEALAFLSRAGVPAFDAVASSWEVLDAPGRRRALDVAAAVTGCEGAAVLYAKAAADGDSLLSKKGEQRLSRCGDKVVAALLPLLKSDPKVRAVAAGAVAEYGGAKTLGALAELLGNGTTEERRAVRSAVAIAARDATHDQIAQLFWLKSASPAARLDLLRALTGRLPAVRPEADVSVATLLRDTPSFDTRYLVLDALPPLISAGDTDAKGVLTRLMVDDPAVPVRTHAVALASELPDLAPNLLTAAADKSPRVREAAFLGLGHTKVKEALTIAQRAIEHDSWAFVRLAAVDAVAGLGPSDATDDVLRRAVDHDAIPSMRAAVIAALGARGVAKAAPTIRDRLSDPVEEVAVRAAAARALSELCDRKAEAALAELANALAAPDATGGTRELALAALRALAHLHPADLEKRVAPLNAATSPPFVREEVARALAAKDICH